MTPRIGTSRGAISSASGMCDGVFPPALSAWDRSIGEWPVGSRVLLADFVDASRMTCIAREHCMMRDSNGNNAANRGLTSLKIGKSPKKWTHHLIWDTL
jgi:hypothetical protein